MSVKALCRFFCWICSFAMLLLIIYGNIVDFGILINYKPEISTVCRQYEKELGNIYTVHNNVLNATTENNYSLCLVTQLSIDRIASFKRLVESFKGPVSASIYANESDQLRKELSSWSNEIQVEWLNVNVIIQKGEHYPVNFLRNIALHTARAEFIFYLDVDFVASQNLYKHILHSYIFKDFFNESKRVLIVPEFATDTEQKALVPLTKENAINQYGKTLRPFDYGNKNFDVDESPTKYTVWLNTGKTYKTSYALNYEPYIVIRKSQMPSFDVHFVDRWFDRLSNILEIVNQCFELFVLADGFVVHIEHARKHSQLKINTYRCIRDTHWQRFKTNLRDRENGCLLPSHYNF